MPETATVEAARSAMENFMALLSVKKFRKSTFVVGVGWSPSVLFVVFCSCSAVGCRRLVLSAKRLDLSEDWVFVRGNSMRTRGNLNSG